MFPSPPTRWLFQLRAALLLLWLARALAGQELGGEPPLSHQSWGTEEGLPDASVHQVFQSRDGYIWLATEGGAVRFDGFNFKVLRRETQAAFASDDVAAIAEDSAGALWFGTADGLIEERGGTAFRRFAEKDGLPSTTIEALSAGADGSLLVLTTAGAVQRVGSHFERIPGLQGEVSGMAPAPDGATWLLEGGSVLRFQRGSLQEVHLPPLPAGPIAGVVETPGGTKWVRSGRWVVEAAPGFQRQFAAGADLPASRVTALSADPDGTAWIGTNHGLFTVAPESGARPEPVEALRGESVLSILRDREGNVWVGTETTGLHALRPRKFRSLPAAAGEAVTSVVAGSDGVLWFGTREDGVHRVQAGVGDRSVPGSLTSPVILAMAPGKHGDVWVGTPDGLNHLAGGKVQIFTSANGLPDDFVRSVLVDDRGVTWAGTRRGLARVEGNAVKTLTRHEGMEGDSIGPLLEGAAHGAAEDLWVGTATGLSHVHGGRIEGYPMQLGGRAGVITALAHDGNEAIWVAVDGAGLWRFADGRFASVRSGALPEKITSMVTDSAGFLWLRAPRGVYRTPVTGLRACVAANAPCAAAVEVYGTMDGLPSDAQTVDGSPGLWQTDTGMLWVATRKGIGVADTAHLPVNRVPPPVVIDSFTVDDSEPRAGKAGIEVGPGHGRYTFAFAALSYTVPAKNRYRYKLEGFDRDWVDAGTARVAYYTSLPPDRYTFTVQAQNNDGVWNEQGASIRFRVLPPIYRRWWFSVLVLLCAGALVLAMLRLRERAIQRRFALVLNERNRMAREIHDTLAQDLVSISLQLDVATSLLQQQQTQEAATQLRSARKLAREGLEAARQSIWNLRATSAVDSLPARMTELTQRYAVEAARPRLKMGGAYRKLRQEVEDEVFRIAQESLSNVYRHAGASEVSVSLHYEPETLQLTVRDNGVGFSKEAASRMEGHYGLRGLQERATALRARLAVTTSPGEGTTVSLLVPLS